MRSGPTTTSTTSTNYFSKIFHHAQQHYIVDVITHMRRWESVIVNYIFVSLSSWYLGCSFGEALFWSIFPSGSTLYCIVTSTVVGNRGGDVGGRAQFQDQVLVEDYRAAQEWCMAKAVAWVWERKCHSVCVTSTITQRSYPSMRPSPGGEDRARNISSSKIAGVASVWKDVVEVEVRPVAGVLPKQPIEE